MPGIWHRADGAGRWRRGWGSAASALRCLGLCGAGLPGRLRSMMGIKVGPVAAWKGSGGPVGADGSAADRGGGARARPFRAMMDRMVRNGTTAVPLPEGGCPRGRDCACLALGIGDPTWTVVLSATPFRPWARRAGALRDRFIRGETVMESGKGEARRQVSGSQVSGSSAGRPGPEMPPAERPPSEIPPAEDPQPASPVPEAPQPMDVPPDPGPPVWTPPDPESPEPDPDLHAGRCLGAGAGATRRIGAAEPWALSPGTARLRRVTAPRPGPHP